MKILLLGVLMALVGIILTLAIANVIVLLLLHDLPWLRLFRAAHDVETFNDLPYVTDSTDRKQRLDFYRPKGKRGYPIVVFVHGGYWTSGDKDYYRRFTGLYASVGIALARQGIGAAVINYRLAPTTTIEGMLADVATAVAWTQSSAAGYEANPDAMWLMGHSAGGHLVTLLAADGRAFAAAGVKREAIKGIIAMSAVYDLEDMAKKNGDAFNAGVTVPTFGADPAALSRYSPVRQFRLGMPRTLMLTAEDDFPYLIPQSEAARRRLEELNLAPEAHVIPGYTHMDMVLKFGRKDDAALQRVAEFIRKSGG